MRRAIVALALVCGTAAAAHAEPLDILARPLPDFGGIAIGQPVGEVIYRGGVELASTHSGFGGISGLGFIDAGERFVAVTDSGDFLSGRFSYDAAGVLSGVTDAEIEPIENSSGVVLPRAFARDAEALDVIIRDGVPSAVRIGFENLTRIADFALTDGRPGGAATVVNVPDWLPTVRTNEAIESVCIAPPASPIAGSTLVITEGHVRAPGTFAATLLGVADRGDLHLAQAGGGFNPTDCAFLPNGDLLVLERAVRFISFFVQVRRIPAADVVRDAIMDGPVILTAGGAEVDNFEAIAIHMAPDGATVMTIVSDDNFRSLQRTLALQFGLPD